MWLCVALGKSLNLSEARFLAQGMTMLVVLVQLSEAVLSPLLHPSHSQRDGMGTEVGAGFRMGNTCTPVADAC